MARRIKNTCMFLILISLFLMTFWYVLDTINNNDNPTLAIYIIFFIFLLYVSIIIHELTHSLVYIFFKLPIRAFCIFPICFINNGNRWSVMINWNYISLMGASVPEQIAIINENDFKRITKVYSRSMLVATISGFIMTIIGLVILIIGYTFFENENISILGSLLLFINFLFLAGAFTRTTNASGDYFAYKYMFNDAEISTHLIYDYMKFSVKYNEIRSNSSYLRNKLVLCFKKKINEKLVNIDAIVIATTFINDFLIRKIDLPEPIVKYIEDLNENLEELEDIKNTEVFKKYITRIAYYYEFIGNSSMAKKLNYNYIMNFSDRPIDKYLKMQAQQIILKEDHTSLLLKRENIKPDSYYSFYRIFDGYINDEMILNKVK
ncbi:UNVERIFIED_CONTAM: hypothetical protein Cloal_0229 [Acetivibrio alkalicellulosi]